MSIVENREKLLRKEIINLFEISENIFNYLIKGIDNNDLDFFEEIHKQEKEFEKIYQSILEFCISNFALAPLGKDLRRNIAYLETIKTSYLIIQKLNSISKYFKDRIIKQSNNKWSLVLLNKLFEEITNLKVVINSEKLEEIDYLINLGKEINDEYIKIIKTRLKKSNEFKKISENNVEAINEEISGFIISTKNIEIISDYIDSIAKNVKFIIEK